MWRLGVIGLIVSTGLSGCVTTTSLAPGATPTVVNCETGYSEDLAKGGKSRAAIEAAFDQCLARAIQRSGPPTTGQKQVFVIRQSASTVNVVRDGKGGYTATPDQRSQPSYACPPGFRGMYRGTLFCKG